MAFAGEILFVLGLIMVSQSIAQSNRQFQWSFRDKSLSDLPTCSPLAILIESFDSTDLTTGIPPYYMISYPIGGMPITSFLGSDTDNLTWTATHPLGSEVILNVVDSTGGSGGVSASPRRVVAGVTTGCTVNSGTFDAFVVSANASGSLSQCETWGITVSGGVPPYVVMLAETSSPVVTNSTPLAIGAIVFTQRANLGGTLLVAVADAQGQWASGTPVVSLEGSTDSICKPALAILSNTTSTTQSITHSGAITSATPIVTSLGTLVTVQVEIAFQDPQTGLAVTPTATSGVTQPTSSDPAKLNRSRQHVKAIAIGLSIPFAVICACAGAIGFYLHRRRTWIDSMSEQPTPFVVPPRERVRYESNNGAMSEQSDGRTSGKHMSFFPSRVRTLGDQLSSRVTLTRDLAARPSQHMSSEPVIRQDHIPDHGPVEEPPDYRSHISEPLHTR